MRVAIVGGVRTPFVKAGGVFAQVSALELASHSVTELVKRFNLKADSIDELVYGSVLLNPRYPNFAREIVLRSDLPNTIDAHFVSNNCITGLVAANAVFEGIQAGRIHCGIAGGVESMSWPTLCVHPKAERIFLDLFRARSFGEKLSTLLKLRAKYLLPSPPSPKEPSTGLTMGQHMEITAKELSIEREVQDAIALKSHVKAALGYESGLIPAEISAFNGVDKDNLVRASTSAEKLASLRSVFDKSEKGTLTAGNSSALTDGASAICLMSEDRAKSEGAEILAFIEGVEYAAVSPDDGLLMAPAVALPKLLQRFSLSIDSVDRFEVHEAFGAQVEANLRVWESGWDKGGEKIAPIGRIPDEKINQYGGSIALGHPFAATGGRLLSSLANSMKQDGLKKGAISVCAAGGMAAAVLLSRD